MFFVLNTGRAGSRTVARTLSQSPNCYCAHEPHPQLVEECARYRYGELDEPALVDALRESRERVVDGKIYGETNNRLSVAVPALHAAFPDARFIHLVRDGRAFVSSGLQRGWYAASESSQTIWERWRMQGDRVGAFSADEWQAASAFERICWLWTYTNQLITSDVRRLIGDDYLLLRIETFPRLADHAAAFLGVEPVPWAIGRANARQREGASNQQGESDINEVAHVLTWQGWDDSQREVFAHRCGALMDELYPDWRKKDGQWESIEEQTPRRDDGRIAPNRLAVAGSPDDSISAIRSDVAELKMLRGELRSLITHSRRVSDALQLELRKSSQQRERLAEQLQEAQATLRELAPQVAELERALVKALSHLQQSRRRTHSLETRIGQSDTALMEAQALLKDRARELADVKKRLEKARRQAKNASRERDQLLASTSYRIGHRLVRVVRMFVPARAGTENRTHDLDQRAEAGAEAVEPAIAKDPSRPLDAMTDSALLPVSTLVVALGGGEDAPSRAVALVEQARRNLRGDGPGPLVVTDSHDFAALRRSRVPFEFLVPEDDWAANDREGTWPVYARNRLAEIVALYGPQRIVVVTESGRHSDVLKLLPGSIETLSADDL